MNKKEKEDKKVIYDFRVRKDILTRWNALAHSIGIPLTSLIHIAMNKYEQNNYTNMTILQFDYERNSYNSKINEKPDKIEINEDVKEKETKPIRNIKCPKCNRYFTKIGINRHKCKTPKNIKKDKKTKTKCPICNNMYDNRGFYLHLTSCEENHRDKDARKQIKQKTIPKDKRIRLKENMKYRDVSPSGLCFD